MCITKESVMSLKENKYDIIGFSTFKLPATLSTDEYVSFWF